MKEKGDRMRRMFLFEPADESSLCIPSALSTWWWSDFNEAFALCRDTGRKREREGEKETLTFLTMVVLLSARFT